MPSFPARLCHSHRGAALRRITQEVRVSELDLDGFEVFDRSSAPAPVIPFVTLQRRGLISLNRGAYEALGAPAAVELLYNRDRRTIAIRPADPTSPRAYALRQQGGEGGSKTYLIAGAAFTAHYQIDTSVARRYRVEHHGEVLLVDLNQEDAVRVTSPRAKDRSGERVATTA
jgi:hypothetical protein